MPFEVYEDESGGFRWRLKSANGEIVAQSESYTRKEDAERAIGDVRNIVSKDGGVNERSDNDS